ncbi:hypothetical protein D9M70_393220 [compost metagenome]
MLGHVALAAQQLTETGEQSLGRIRVTQAGHVDAHPANRGQKGIDDARVACDAEDQLQLVDVGAMLGVRVGEAELVIQGGGIDGAGDGSDGGSAARVVVGGVIKRLREGQHGATGAFQAPETSGHGITPKRLPVTAPPLIAKVAAWSLVRWSLAAVLFLAECHRCSPW